MELIAVVAVGCLASIGMWLLLHRDLLRVVLGVAVLGNAINMLVLTAGRFGFGGAAFVGVAGAPAEAANPLPQALVLTAIVIGFGLFVFALGLLWQVWITHGTTETDRVTARTEDAAAQPPEPRR